MKSPIFLKNGAVFAFLATLNIISKSFKGKEWMSLEDFFFPFWKYFPY